MWEPRNPREPRSIAGTRLRHIEMHESRLAQWPPPMRDTVTPPAHEPPPVELPAEMPVKAPPRRNWFLKGSGK
ncbi:hypothetical protein RPMA_15440 [Tardiphaga alba]|uniref:Uncharacterized protein n=1 Tax=Tardiphaga alba TaxID=340268 RepID=A0ABX8ACB9_9BRAD|nr:hypothetical protein RPMA_15440 [Tardiphaga alba]